MTNVLDTVPFLDLGAQHLELQPQLDSIWHEVVDQSAFIAGDYATRFEDAWANYCGTRTAIGTANGTDSIELTLRALGIGRGDEVIIPSNTFIATAEAAIACGATPVYVDVDPATLLVTGDHLAAAITPRTAALIPVHLYGQPCQMDAIVELGERYGLAVIEDAAQAHGALWRGKVAGGLGTAASFSFYPGKNLGAFGDAGAVVTNDEQLAAKVRSLANHGRADGAHVTHALMGRNSRLDGLQAGVLSVKLGYLDEWNAARQSAHQTYLARLNDSAAVVPVQQHPDATSVFHLNVVQVPERDRVAAMMRQRGVDVRVHYPQPCHQHPSVTNPQSLPVVEAAAARVLSLPMYPTVNEAEIDYVCSALDAALAELGYQEAA